MTDSGGRVGEEDGFMVSVEKDLLIIDGDSHVLEPPDLWDEYLEPEFRPRAIRITRSIPGRDGETRGRRGCCGNVGTTRRGAR